MIRDPDLINQTLAWTGETLDKITDAAAPGNTETLTYTNSHRLKSALGAYGSLAWTCDADGNRQTQIVNAVAQNRAENGAAG